MQVLEVYWFSPPQQSSQHSEYKSHEQTLVLRKANIRSKELRKSSEGNAADRSHPYRGLKIPISALNPILGPQRCVWSCSINLKLSLDERYLNGLRQAFCPCLPKFSLCYIKEIALYNKKLVSHGLGSKRSHSHPAIRSFLKLQTQQRTCYSPKQSRSVHTGGSANIPSSHLQHNLILESVSLGKELNSSSCSCTP